MSKNKITLLFFLIPLFISVLSSMTTGSFMVLGQLSGESSNSMIRLALNVIVYTSTMSLLAYIYYQPVLRFFKRQDNQESIKKRLKIMPLLYLYSTVLIKLVWILFTLFPHIANLKKAGDAVFISTIMLLLFISVLFPSFVAFIAVKELMGQLMKNLFVENALTFDPENGSIKYLILFFILIVSVFPVMALVSMVMAGDQLLTRYLPDEIKKSHNNLAYLILTVLTILGSIFFSIIMTSRHLQKSIQTLLQVFKKIEKGDFSSNVPVTSIDELGQISFSLNQMIYGLRDREMIKRQFGNYVSPEIRDYIIKNKNALQGEEKVVTVLFTDIQGYTSISEKLTPQETVTLLNEYYTMLVEIVQNHKGVVSKFIGDSLMAVFNAPLDDPEHALNAIRCAQEIVTITDNFEFLGNVKLITRVGINTGKVIAGNLGSKDRYEYTFIGDSVNLAQRLEQIGKKFDKPIIFSEYTYEYLGDNVASCNLGKVKVKGKTEHTRIYTIEN